MAVGYTYDTDGVLWRLDVNPDGTIGTTVVTAVGPSTSGLAPSITAQGVITSAMRLIGAVASGETPTTDELNDGLSVLNDMIDGWNAESLMIFTNGNYQEFPLTVGQQDYTMGLGGDFNTTRPAEIERMGIVSLNNPAQPLELPMAYLTQAQWASIPVKLINSTLPLAVYDDGGFPLRTLHFRYIPLIPCNVRVYSWTPLSYFYNLSNSYSFPPSYAKAIRYNLAVDLAAEFGIENAMQFQLVTAQAIESKAIIKRKNSKLLDLKCDSALVGNSRTYNWITDNANGR